ncbi:MAG: AAA family ATPase, partial [Leadbetterella sp.]
MYTRRQVFEGAEGLSLFFWGARQTGKSTLLKQFFPDALSIDLLKTDQLRRFIDQPYLLREIVQAQPDLRTIVIDEIQKIPELLNEVHWLIENSRVQFILSGSSPRKILRAGSNLLGGRALRYDLFPLS